MTEDAAAAPSSPQRETIFVTGATGYVGGRLVPLLLEAGYRVRCLVREPRKLDARPWRQHPQLEVVNADLADREAVTEAMRGCKAAYYLVHSMVATGGTYADRDRDLARMFANAARSADLPRIIYLGGLGEMGPDLSQHLRSRRQVEEELASSDIPVTTFRAAMIIGSGSASFEILRYLVERLPVMITPKWVTTECQPVAISDVLHWLVSCLEVPDTTGRTLEIGGDDVMAYQELMRVMAEELGLQRRIILPVPVLTPRLSSHWINLVTPVSYRIARPLAEGLKNRVVVTDDTTQRLMPHKALGAREAIRRALQKIEQQAVETRWSVAGPVPGDPSWAGGTVFTDERVVDVEADPASLYAAICRIGGGNGWYAGDVLWRIRGWMDTLVGGPGLRRGRRLPETVEFGETLDFWRVVGIDRDRFLSLRAEMKLPGEAQLDFKIEPIEPNREPPITRLVMTARFRPRGLAGLLYWYAVVPLHEFVFGGMLRGIRKTAEAMHRSNTPRQKVSPAHDEVPGYGRARLWLGITGVGSIVTISSAALFFRLPEQFLPGSGAALSNQINGILAFILLYTVLQLPLDLFGGYLLPRQYQRQHPRFNHFLAVLLRGVCVHSALLALIGITLLLAARTAGILGVVGIG
ncbi:MAG: SDR family oxidoreductase, partial [Pirellulales bacterium]